MSNEDNLLKRTVYEEEELPVQGEGRRQDVEGKVNTNNHGGR